MVLYVLIGLAAIIVLAYLLRHQISKALKEPVFLLCHYFYYRNGAETWGKTAWMGVPLLKLPLDLWRYHDILWATKPDLIIETGTNKGGSALYFAHLCDLMGTGRIVTVDIASPPEGVPSHPRIKYVIGSSTDKDIFAKVRAETKPGERVMVILDSDHARDHVLGELALYPPLVTPGCYLVVEDTNVNGHPVSRSHGPGPMEALYEFWKTPMGKNFQIDAELEGRYLLTFYPKGWMKRVA